MKYFSTAAGRASKTNVDFPKLESSELSAPKNISSVDLSFNTSSDNKCLVHAPSFSSQDMAMLESLTWSYESPTKRDVEMKQAKKVSRKSIVIPAKENSLAPVRSILLHK